MGIMNKKVIIVTSSDGIAIFSRWLKENGLYEKYCYAFKEHAKRYYVSLPPSLIVRLKDYEGSLRLRHAIVSILNTLSFFWNETKEGRDFWDDVNRRWQEYICKILNG